MLYSLSNWYTTQECTYNILISEHIVLSLSSVGLLKGYYSVELATVVATARKDFSPTVRQC